MGFFNYLFKSLGFPEKEKVDESNINLVSTEIQNANFVRPIDDQKEINLNNLIVYAPKNSSEIHLLVDCLKRGEAIIIDLSNLCKNEVQRILDYINGALQALNGTLNRLQGNLFVLTPKNINIATI